MLRARTLVATVATVATVGGGVALPPGAYAAAPGNSWSMDLVGDVVPDADGTQPMTFGGKPVQSAKGRDGGAVRFAQAPSFATIADSAGDNPGTSNFAMGIVFTSQPVSGRSYSGNLMQKGFFNDAGQVKMQLVPASQGTVNCRIKGTAGAQTITSTVTVDDGGWHSAVCWRAGDMIGLTVDGMVQSRSWNPGSVSNGERLSVGNKGPTGGASDQHFGSTDFASWVIDPDARAVVERQVSSGTSGTSGSGSGGSEGGFSAGTSARKATTVNVKRPRFADAAQPSRLIGRAGLRRQGLKVTPGLASARVLLQVRGGSGSWRTLDEGRVGVTGRFILEAGPKAALRTLRVVLRRHRGYAGTVAAVPPAPIAGCKVTSGPRAWAVRCRTTAKNGSLARLFENGEVVDVAQVREGRLRLLGRGVPDAHVVAVRKGSQRFVLHL